MFFVSMLSFICESSLRYAFYSHTVENGNHGILMPLSEKFRQINGFTKEFYSNLI